MPPLKPRRAHQKSRLGCDQCKHRRVKCDEKGPPCSNCISRELNCTYLRAPPKDLHYVRPPRTTNRVPRSPDTPRTLAPSPAASSPSAISGVRDLELMHHFATATFRSVCTSESEYEVWQIIVPRLALQYEFLMNGVLALAALHIATAMELPNSLAYIDTALQYHNLSFAPFRASIDNLTPQNCEAVAAQSIITTVISIALPRITAVRDESSNMTENIIVVFELLQGVKNIYDIGRAWIKLKFFSRRKDDTDPSELDADTVTALDRLATINEEAFKITVDTDQYQINTDVIAHLRRCCNLFASTEDPAHVLAWLAAVDKEFVDNVRRGQPLALLILMHWGIFLGKLDGHRWWAQNSGRALVSELLRVIQPGDAQWTDSLSWSQRKMGL
ncbi:hypothetical protein N7495_009177 [Penicillium taxi]|uniref:uncharacterized protein n=1 Tax=Penicillium taxi TaxID=168475 RepID=UPI0025453C72|nr:uncharacterized protein N7495_009177 [Penicillium taxi]KAJ5884667.1 hypothetical protein N7495_009177 [Penicillium taxi]